MAITVMPVLSLTSGINKSPQSLFYEEEVTFASLMLFPRVRLDPSTCHLGEAGSIRASSGQLGLELAKPGWLEAELETVQIVARSPVDWFCELESVGIQAYSGYLETLLLEAKFRAVAFV